MWAALFRGLLTGGGRAAAARGAAAGGAARSGGARSVIGKGKAAPPIGQSAPPRPRWFRRAAKTPAPKVSQTTSPTGGGTTYTRATRKQQHVNYLRNLMNNQQNLQPQHHVTPQHPQPGPGQQQQNAGGWLRAAGKLLANVTGLSDAFDGTKKLLKGDFWGAIKSAASASVKLWTTMIGLPIAIKRWSDALVESRREMAKYSGRTLTAFARMDVAQIRRDFQFSRGTASSSSRLVDATNEFRDAFQPLRQDLTTVANALATVVVHVGTNLANLYSTMRKFVPLIGPFLNWLERRPDEKDKMPILEYMKAYRDYANDPNNKPLPGW